MRELSAGEKLSIKTWYEAGVADRKAGNTIPAVTKEDFFRDYEDSLIADLCAKAYDKGFREDI